MKVRNFISITIVLLLGLTLVLPVFGQRNAQVIPVEIQGRDEAAIRSLLNYYEQAFNDRDIEWRMSLCLDSYQEIGFINGIYDHTWDYDRVRREVGGYWASIDRLEYSMDEVEIEIDGPMAYVRAYTTHLAPNDRHASIVHFQLVKIDGLWRIAWDSYNIVRGYDD